MRMRTATETDCNNNAEGNWNRKKEKTDVEEIEKEEGFDRGMKAGDEENKRMRWNSLRMLYHSFWFYDSSLYLPSLSLFHSPYILCVSNPSLSLDTRQTERFGETQLFYRWDQREIVCACTFMYLCPCDFKNIYDVVLADLSFKGLGQVYTRFRIKVSIKSRSGLLG